MERALVRPRQDPEHLGLVPDQDAAVVDHPPAQDVRQVEGPLELPHQEVVDADVDPTLAQALWVLVLATLELTERIKNICMKCCL